MVYENDESSRKVLIKTPDGWTATAILQDRLFEPNVLENEAGGVRPTALEFVDAKDPSGKAIPDQVLYTEHKEAAANLLIELRKLI